MISTSRINEIFKDCLSDDDDMVSRLTNMAKKNDGNVPESEIPEGYKVVYGVAINAILNKEKLESYKEEIKEMISQLPTEFYPAAEGGGGGWSFLNLCTDKDGNQWGEQIDADKLFMLASGLKLAKSVVPIELWRAFPGGVPYIVFSTNELKYKEEEAEEK